LNFTKADRLSDAFSDSSEIGFAILDSDLRYRSINPCLAEINGLPDNAHLGFKVREIFGDLSVKFAEPHYHKVLGHHESTRFEVLGVQLPSRPKRIYWGLNVNFPIEDVSGTVNQIGIVVLEITQQRELQRFLGEIATNLRSAKSEQSCWFAHKIRRCMNEYISTLAATFEDLLGTPTINFEQLTESIKALDQRLGEMRQTTAELEMSFPGANR
jgi:hypothetical protein